MKTSIERRSLLKLTGAAAGALALGALSGCSAEGGASNAANANNAFNGNRGENFAGPKGEGRGHHGQGRPEFKKPMNQARLVAATPDEEEALAKFMVISDTHVSYNYEPYGERAKNMFEDIAANCPDLDAIVVVGDITDHGRLDEYEMFAQHAEASGFTYPDDFIFAIGNHDQYDSTEGAQPVSNLTDRFREQIGISDQVHPYYDRTVNGVHLIMLGPDSYPDGNWAHFGVSDEEVQWMDGLVAADKEDGVLSMVFLHEPLYRTVRLTDPGDFGHEWSLSSEDNDNLHEHVRRHQNLVFFTGHTHALPDIVQLQGESPLFVGTGSVAYCMDDVDDDFSGYGDMDEYGSLGWEVTVWTSCIRFRCRDFLARDYSSLVPEAIYEF